MGWVIGNGRGIVFRMGSSQNWSSYWIARHPELATYIEGLTIPLSNAQIIKIGEFLEALKTGLSISALSEVFDVMYLLAGETQESSLKNLVKDLHHCTSAAMPTFTTLKGFKGNGSSQFLDTNYNPSTQGSKYTRNDASLGVYSNENINENKNDLGSYAGTILADIATRYSDVSYFRLNNANSSGVSQTQLDSLGLFVVTRNGSANTNLYGYKNKTTYSTRFGSSATSAISNLNMYLCAYNDDGSATNFSTKQLSFAFAGKYITTAMRDIIYDAFIDYFNPLPFRDFTGITRYAGNPIVPKNTTVYNTYGAGAPFFKLENKIGSTYYAYVQVSSTDVNGFNDIALYTSDDLLIWTPQGIVIDKGTGLWDNTLLLHPTTVKIGSTWYMYYSAKNAALKYNIGLATSTDLVNWTKHASNPIYTTATGAYSPCVIQIGSTYYMYYWNAVIGAGALMEYATSSDGVTWTYGGIALPTPTATEWDYDASNMRLIDPSVIRNSNGIYEMIYTFSKGSFQQLGHAVSYDGQTWYKYPAAIFAAGSAAWENAMVGDSCYIQLPDNSIYMYYGGVAAPGATSIEGGLATL